VNIFQRNLAGKPRQKTVREISPENFEKNLPEKSCGKNPRENLPLKI
jgi:hypothetical protein